MVSLSSLDSRPAPSRGQDSAREWRVFGMRRSNLSPSGGVAALDHRL